MMWLFDFLLHDLLQKNAEDVVVDTCHRGKGEEGHVAMVKLHNW